MESSATASDGGRFRQAVKLCRRAKQLLDDAGLQAHEVRPGVLVPILEGAALADDDEALQDRWAALLANAATKPADAIPPSFPPTSWASFLRPTPNCSTLSSTP